MKNNLKIKIIILLILLLILILILLGIYFKLYQKKEEFRLYYKEGGMGDTLSPTLSPTNYLNKKEAYNEIFRDETFLKDDNLYQLRLKLNNLNITELNRDIIIKKVFSENILEFTNEDKYLINLYINKIPYKWNWTFIKITDTLANNLPYTVNNAIILYPKFIKSLNTLKFNINSLEILIHERIHVFQRYNLDLFERVYNKLGFYKINDKLLISKIKNNKNIVSNPDGLDFWKIKINNKFIIPILININNNKFATLSYNYYILDDYDYSKLYDLNKLKEYEYRLFCNENIHNKYHPNEISADLLSLYILQKIYNKPINSCIEKNYIDIIKVLNF